METLIAVLDALSRDLQFSADRELEHFRQSRALADQRGGLLPDHYAAGKAAGLLRAKAELDTILDAYQRALKPA